MHDLSREFGNEHRARLTMKAAKAHFGPRWASMTATERLDGMRSMGLLDSDSDSSADESAGERASVSSSSALQRLALRLAPACPVGPSSSMYSSRTYWEQRLALGGADNGRTTLATEWYLGYSELRPHIVCHAERIRSRAAKRDRALHVLSIGCGVSEIEDDMALEGLGAAGCDKACAARGSSAGDGAGAGASAGAGAGRTENIPARCRFSVTAVDFAASCFAARGERAGRAQASGLPTPNFAVMDVRRLPLRDGLFEIVLDKGTLDALLTDEADGMKNAMAMLQEVRRTLKPGGVYLVVSHSPPDDGSRGQLFPFADWAPEGSVEIPKNAQTVWVSAWRTI